MSALVSMQAALAVTGAAGRGTALKSPSLGGGSAVESAERAGSGQFAAMLAEASAVPPSSSQGTTGEQSTGSTGQKGEGPPPEAGDAGDQPGPPDMLAAAAALALVVSPGWAVAVQQPQGGAASAPDVPREAPVAPATATLCLNPAGTAAGGGSPGPVGASGSTGSAVSGLLQAGPLPGRTTPATPSAQPGQPSAAPSVLPKGPAAALAAGTQVAAGRGADDSIRSAVEFYLRALGWDASQVALSEGHTRGQASMAAAGASRPAGLAWPFPGGQGGVSPERSLDAGVETVTAAAAVRGGPAPGVQVVSGPQGERAFVLHRGEGLQAGEASQAARPGAGPAEHLSPAVAAVDLAESILGASGRGETPAVHEAATAPGFQAKAPAPAGTVVTGSDGPGGPEFVVRQYAVVPASRLDRPAPGGGSEASSEGGGEAPTPQGESRGRAFVEAAAQGKGAAPAAGTEGTAQLLRPASNAGQRARQHEPSSNVPDRSARTSMNPAGSALPEAGASETVPAPGHGQAGEDPQTPLRETARLVASHVSRWFEQTQPATLRRAEVVAARIAQDGGEIRLQLHPPEMGELRLVLSTEGSRLTVHVLAQQPDTGQLLRQHAGTLQQALEQAGLHLAGFSVEVGHQAMSGQRSPLPWSAPPSASRVGAWASPSAGESMVAVREEPAWVRLGMAAVDVRV